MSSDHQPALQRVKTAKDTEVSQNQNLFVVGRETDRWLACGGEKGQRTDCRNCPVSPHIWKTPRDPCPRMRRGGDHTTVSSSRPPLEMSPSMVPRCTSSAPCNTRARQASPSLRIDITTFSTVIRGSKSHRPSSAPVIDMSTTDIGAGLRCRVLGSRAVPNCNEQATLLEPANARGRASQVYQHARLFSY